MEGSGAIMNVKYNFSKLFRHVRRAVTIPCAEKKKKKGPRQTVHWSVPYSVYGFGGHITSANLGS